MSSVSSILVEQTARRRGSTHAATARIMAMLVATVLVTFLSVASSRAAFSAVEDPTEGGILVGGIELTDNDAGAALFDHVTDLLPGVVLDSCIDVTYAGDPAAAPVVLYAPQPPGGTLAPYLELTVELGGGAAGFGDCTAFVPEIELFRGTLDELGRRHADHATGIAAWVPTTTPDTRTFRFAAELRPDDDAQGRWTTFEVAWEARSP